MSKEVYDEPSYEEQGYQKKETPDSTDDDPVEGYGKNRTMMP